MTYKEFVEIMKAEELEESELVRYYLREAGKHQKYMKMLENHNSPNKAIEIQNIKKSNAYGKPYLLRSMRKSKDGVMSKMGKK
ncbi:hypothetical protein F522_09435 [Enterococcus hirae 81-15-F4]|nr:hypothetical protein F522_09435 [Enterococcus hirae 81-15-F4]